MNYVSQAWDDWYKLCEGFKKAPLRKASVDWCLPNKIWMMLFLPKRRTKPIKLGVGAEIPEISNRKFNANVVKICTQIRTTGQTPLKWHVAQGYQLDKNNGMSGTSGIRVILASPILGSFFWQHV